MVGTGVFTSAGFQAHDLHDPATILIAWVVGGVLAFRSTRLRRTRIAAIAALSLLAAACSGIPGVAEHILVLECGQRLVLDDEDPLDELLASAEQH